MSFADHFSKQSVDYAKYRPGYPQALFDWLESLTSTHDLAWDVGTGNGQAAVELARFFDQVVATDPSAAQISNAALRPNISYRVQTAEQSDLADCSVDLVTIAQALHWFDFERFFGEARRVLKPTGIVAAWTYALNDVTPEIDAIVRHYYREIVGMYWPPQRKYVDDCYRTIPFPPSEDPNPDITVPAFRMETDWTLRDYIGYLHTWSATQRYLQSRQSDPVALIAESLENAWAPQSLRRVYWPIYVRVARANQVCKRL